MEALKKLREKETELLEFEAEQLYELFRVREVRWPQPPRLAPFCAVGTSPQVASLKNEDRSCGEFTPTFARGQRSCRTCTHVQDPETRIGDRENPIDRHDPEYWKHWMGVNHEQENADAAAQGLELEATFAGDGVLATPRFLPTCGAQTAGVGRMIVPVCNLQSDCALHRPVLPISASFLDTLKIRAWWRPTPILMPLMVELTKLVAATHPESPGDFLESVPAAALAWARFVVARRWLPEVGDIPGDQRARVQARMGHVDSLGVWPVVIGCDALEWGTLASMARGKERMVSSLILQQAIEWCAASFHPTARRHGLEALRALLQSDAFPGTIAQECDGLLLRMQTAATDEEVLLVDDPALFIEAALDTLSTRVSLVRSQQQERQREREMRRKGTSAEMAEKMGMGPAQRRDMILNNVRIGVQVAGRLLNLLDHKLLFGVVPGALHAWEEIHSEDTLHAQQGLMQLVEMTITALRENSHGGVDPVSEEQAMRLQANAKSQVADQMKRIDALVLRPRRVRLRLLLTRGAEPVTPSLLSLVGGTVAYEKLPLEIAEALERPTSHTLEYFHQSRFDSAPESNAYRSRIRRIPAPLVENDVVLF